MKRRTNIAQHPCGLILKLLGLMSVVTLILGSVALAQPDPIWIPTGSLNTPRSSHTATLLPNGKVLVAGGRNGSVLNSAELYDPPTGAWSTTGTLNMSRQGHTATLLPNGKVLIAGGFPARNSAELYDPATGTWSITGSLNTARFGFSHTATLLPNGKVLVIDSNSAELYDSASGTWSVTGNPIEVARFWHTAILLQNGMVLVTGGGYESIPNLFFSLASSELYNPATGTWSSTGSLNQDRGFHTATLLPDGKVLVAGGGDESSDLNSSELYDPATGAWRFTGSLIANHYGTATLLPNGKVLVAGGWNQGPLNISELYDPATGAWSPTASLNTPRDGHTATLLQTGKVLVAGGERQGAPLGSAELYGTSDLSLTDLTVNLASPQPLDTAITFTATASGGTASLQFKWWVFNGSVWSVGQDWSSRNTFNWTPTADGNYMIGVWARSSGNTADAAENDALRTMSFTITAPADLTVTSLTSDRASPQPLGSSVLFTATASGGRAPLQFKWWVFNGSVWSVGQNWSTSNTFNWVPTVGGEYIIGVWARSSTNIADAPENNALRTMAFTIAGPPALSVSGLTADKPSPQPLGSTVTFTATAFGGTPPLQFKWWVFNGAVWSVGQDWSTSNTFNWTASAEGDYIIGVWARSNGNTADAAENNAIGVVNFAVTAPAVSLVHAFADVPYAIRITASQGCWFATSVNFSEYQPAALPLSVLRG